MIYFFKTLSHRINKASIASAISILALLVSIGGLGISAWNITISKRSFNHALKVHQKNEDKSFEQLRLDFLIEVSDDLEVMNEYFIEIYKLKMKLNEEPQPIKDSMKNSLSKFNHYSTFVMLAIVKLNAEWKTAASYSNKDDYKKLIIDKAIFYRDFKTNIVLKESIQNSITEFSTNLQKAEKKNKVSASVSEGTLAAKMFSPAIIGSVPVFNDQISSK